MTAPREGNLEAPTRHNINWKDPDFLNEESLYNELERVFDLCHGCRRCVSLCQSFPVLFDLVDESSTMEVDGVDKKDYMKVVDQCYLCDLCYMTKCPYTPPHEWNIDFPHLMLRAKAFKYKQGEARKRDKILTSTDTVGKLAGIPIVVNFVNAGNKNGAVRNVLEKTLGVSARAHVPEYHSKTFRKQESARTGMNPGDVQAGETTRGKVALFATCYGNYNEPDVAKDMVAVLEHNGIPVTLAEKEQCCGMPKLELGDLEAVEKAKEANIPVLAKLVDEGWDLIAPVPSCTLMFKQELPLMFPDDPDVRKVAEAFYDPFEYLSLRNKEGLLNTDFSKNLGKVSYHVACHQRVQNIGPKTREVLSLIPGIEIDSIERCSGHDGTYGVKAETFDFAVKIGRPVANRVKKNEPEYFTSDCPIAGHHIGNVMGEGSEPTHPMSLLRIAYGLGD
jgi:glycerol-3-phosphate dehydrogenase subunit C